MDEQRMQTYVGLIEQLLGCPQGEEAELLQANAELVDAGLVVVLEQIADGLESQGNGNALWMRQLAAQLAQALELGEGTLSSSASKDVMGFGTEIVQLIDQARGDRAQVYEFFRVNIGRLDEALLRALPDLFAMMIQQNEPSVIALAFGAFGGLIQQFPFGSRMLNLELGITAYEQALQVFTRTAYSQEWAAIQNNLAAAYSNRIRGERADNLEREILVYEQVLQVRTRDAFPVDWARTQNNLATAYSGRIRGQRADNLERAISAFELSLQVYTRDGFPEDWAMTQNNLATAYWYRIRGERADNLERAISAYEQALQVRTRDDFPEQWATAQHDLAATYSERIRGERAENLEWAISTFEHVLQVRTRDAFPVDWAATQNSLAIVYRHRIKGERADNLERAIDAYEQALQVRTRDAFPEDWAATQNNLANVYLYRIRGERADNLEQAIAVSKQVLQVYTRDAFPENWAITQNNLATAYLYRIRGERAENLERAISACEQALQVRTRDASPENWAITQNNLANAYSNRIRGERVDNLERAITTYEQALQVYTCESFPEDWARTQNNLATTYLYRIRGEQADNLERAISACEQALQVYTRDAFPKDWAMTQNNLALAYVARIRGERTKNLERAIVACEQALQVYTRDAFPEDWARMQNNLMIAYADRIQGERAENLEWAIAVSEQALQVYTRDAFPEDWARTQNNLASVYRDHIQGERAENLEWAIAVSEQALQVYTRDAFPEDWARTQNSLAIAYADRIRGERAENLERAIAAFEQALQVYTRDAFPKDCRQTAKNLGILHFQEKSWAAAVNACQLATAAAETLYQASISYEGKGDELKATADIRHRLAYAQAQLGNLQAAVLTLEQGRARGLSESLDRDRADLAQLQTLAPNLYTEYQNITQQLRNLESRDRDRMVSTDRDRVPDELINTTTKLRQALDQTIAQIRQVPGYEDFLTPTQWEDIAIALRRDNPLVYLVTTANGGMALIVTVEAIDPVWLDGLNETQLVELLNNTWLSTYRNWINAIQRFKVAIKELKENPSEANQHAYKQSESVYKQAEVDWHDAIDTTTRQLWDALMGPLVQKFQELGCHRITLIPTGYLSLLPLHTAWTEDESKPSKRRYAFDDIHITYAPNAKALTAARSIRDLVQAESILAIDNPSQDLDNSEREIQTAIASFLPQATILRHHRATTTAVKAALHQAAIAHFSCHGTANLTEPLTSGLAMSDGLLTLKDIFALNLAESGGLRLAILSACETGIQGIENADEAVSLPTGLLQAGVAAVISSLWSVSDLSTRILLTRFYDLWRKEHLEPSVALRQAQLWMRETSSQQKAKYFQETNPDLFQALIFLRPDYFAHPFHWAAFSYTGA